MYEKMTGSSKKEVIDEASPLIKETQDIGDFVDALIDMAIENNIISSEDIGSDRVVDTLYDVWDKMGFDDYEETGQGISTSDYNAALEMFKNMTGSSKKEVIDEASPLINEDMNFFDYESWKDSFPEQVIFKELGRGVNAIDGNEIVGWWDDSEEKGVNFFD
jgi:hypothetical protein